MFIDEYKNETYNKERDRLIDQISDIITLDAYKKIKKDDCFFIEENKFCGKSILRERNEVRKLFETIEYYYTLGRYDNVTKIINYIKSRYLLSSGDEKILKKYENKNYLRSNGL